MLELKVYISFYHYSENTVNYLKEKIHFVFRNKMLYNQLYKHKTTPLFVHILLTI